jgi:single-stranded-DNA-specific exonuclease
VTLACEKVGLFRQLLNLYASERLTPDDFVHTIEVDATLDLSELNDRSASQILSLAPFGCGNPAPSFAVLGAQLAGPAAIGEKLIKVPVRQNGRTLFLKSWNDAERWQTLELGAHIDIAVCIEEDTYSASRGYPSWGGVIKDFRPAAAVACSSM